jgi:hypothetical protein
LIKFVHLFTEKFLLVRLKVTDDKRREARRMEQPQSHMPDSNLYEKIIPAALIGLGLLTAVLILVGLGIAFGIIPY